MKIGDEQGDRYDSRMTDLDDHPAWRWCWDCQGPWRWCRCPQEPRHFLPTPEDDNPLI